MKANPPSERARVKRVPSRGAYDKETIYSILDEGLVCHVGFVLDGQPFVIPKSYARAGDRLIIHGSTVGQLTRAMKKNADICVAVSFIDGLVVARSAFHHTVNYRSVVVFGKATLIEGLGKVIGGRTIGSFLSQSVSPVWVDLSLTTAPISPATI